MVQAFNPSAQGAEEGGLEIQRQAPSSVAHIAGKLGLYNEVLPQREKERGEREREREGIFKYTLSRIHCVTNNKQAGHSDTCLSPQHLEGRKR